MRSISTFKANQMGGEYRKLLAVAEGREAPGIDYRNDPKGVQIVASPFVLRDYASRAEVVRATLERNGWIVDSYGNVKRVRS